MALRTINAPGIEIREVDKSDYARDLTGSHVLVAGFADRGQDFVTRDITSRNTWLNIYGDPTNEAESYFYKACMEVLNNGGNLHCSKIPYTNAISANYIEQVFKVNVVGQPLSESPFLSTVSELDPTIQKFFYITTDMEDSDEDLLARRLKVFYEANKEEIDQLVQELEDGGSMNSFVDSIGQINGFLDFLNPDPSASRTAQHSKLLSLFTMHFDKEALARAGSSIDEIMGIIHRNMKKAIAFKEEELRDLNVQQEWFASLKYGLDNAKEEVFDRPEAVRDAVDSFADALLETIPDVKYKVQRSAKKVSKEGSTGGQEDPQEPDVDVSDDGDGSSTETTAQELCDLLRALSKGVVSTGRNSNVVILPEDDYEAYLTGEKKPNPGELRIVDVSRTKYGKAFEKKTSDPYIKECLGFMPVITTAANALYCQQMLATSVPGEGFNISKDIRTLDFGEWRDKPEFPYKELEDDCFVLESDELACPLGVVGSCDQSYANAYRDSLTMRACSQFPALFFDDGTKVNREHLKDIGIVVLKTFINRNDSSKVDYEVVEAFSGSVDPLAVNPSTGASTFIDNIVNNQSEYIRCFSNVVYDSNRASYMNCDIGYIHDASAGIMGIYEWMLVKKVSYRGILKSLDKVFDINSDLNATILDIVLDAGISNIAMYAKCVSGDLDVPVYYEPCGSEQSKFKMKTASDTSNTLSWKTVLERYDTFCRKTRRDCMFVSDCPRPFALSGKKKTVRPSRKDTNIDTTIIPLLRYMVAPNTSYGAGYCNWFEEVDEFTGNMIWVPPSIKAVGSYINCDINYNYWDAPAGLTRGLISSSDVAFNPNIQQAGNIYVKNWNYAIKYPDEGVVLEGQKTFQTRASAFDRVNVRRLFLRLERYVYNQARYFVYEPNTALTRQRLVDRIEPYFKTVQAKGGMYDYRIICDETINTPEVIDRNELRLTIGIKPTKTIEFILIQFVALRTGGSWEELDGI